MKRLFFFLFQCSFGILFSQVPDGGIMLNSETGTTYQRIGKCTLTEESVSGQSFTEALRLSVGTDVSNSWDAQVKFPAAAGFEQNDVILVAFYARTILSDQETGEGRLTVCIEHNVSYAKELYYNISIGQDWEEYYAQVEAQTALSASDINYAFHIGFPSQTIEIAEVRFLNYKNTLTLEDLPVTEITYIGQDPDASWRAPARERINQIRKGQAEIIVYDEAGQVLKDASIHIEMVRHQFGFGSAIAANTFNSNATYRNKVLEMFNEVVFENDLKWPQFSPGSTDHISSALDSLHAHNIGVRGHNVIWPAFRWCPSFLETLSNDPVALQHAINTRIDAVTGFTEGRLIGWDVINEPYSEHELQDILGYEVMADWFKRVRRNDRGVKMYINDYSILSSGGKNTDKQDYYYDVIEYIDSLGGGIEGIGMQGHFSSELTSIERVYEILERYAALGKEIKITEHDIDLNQRNVQADYTRDFMTIVFSHPSVKSLLTWGFWEGRHWRPEAAFFDSDWTIRPHGEVWNDLVFNQWWTPDLDAISGEQGEVSFAGYLGTYAYTISDGETERTGTFTIDHSHQSGLPNAVVISLDEAVPEAVSIIPSKPGFLCQGETVTLQAPEGAGLDYTWYRNELALPDQTSGMVAGEVGSYTVQISKDGISLLSAPYELDVRPLPESSVTVTGDLLLYGGNTVTFTGNTAPGLEYDWMKGNIRIPGEGSSVDIGEAGNYSLITTVNGCSAQSESIEVTVNPLPEVQIEALGETSFCEGEEVILRTIPTPDVTYSWKKDDTDLEHEGFWITVTESGFYSVSGFYQGYSDTSETLEVIVFPIPEATITTSGEPTFCEGSSVTLTANSGEDLVYTWMQGNTVLESTEQTIVVEAGGSYTVTTSDASCTATSDPVVVSVLDPTDPQCATGIEPDQLATLVYPNPCSGFFNLQLGGPTQSETHVEVYDAQGKMILKKEIEPGSSLVTISLPGPGFYMLRINGKEDFRVISY